MNIIYAFSAGMGILGNYRSSEKCISNLTDLFIRYDEVFKTMGLPAELIDTYGTWLEFTLSLGNTSTTYKGCVITTEGSLY